MGTEVTIKRSIEIKPGVHTGKITSIRRRGPDFDGGPYDYADIVVAMDKPKGIELKYNCALNAEGTIGAASKLGRTLAIFGVDMEAMMDKKLTLEDTFVDKKVTFQTKNVKGKRGGIFAEIVEDTLEPVK